MFHIPFSHVFFFNRQERTHAQQLRDEQDEAYYESVRADQEKVSCLGVVPKTRGAGSFKKPKNENK